MEDVGATSMRQGGATVRVTATSLWLAATLGSAMALCFAGLATSASAQDRSKKSEAKAGRDPNSQLERDHHSNAVKSAFLVGACKDMKRGCGAADDALWEMVGTATFIYANESHAYFLTAAHVATAPAGEAPKRYLTDWCAGGGSDDLEGKPAARPTEPNRRLSIKSKKTLYHLLGEEVARVYEKSPRGNGELVLSADVALIEAKLPVDGAGKLTAFADGLARLGSVIELRFGDLPPNAKDRAYYYGYPYTASSSVPDPDAELYDQDFKAADKLLLLSPAGFDAPRFAALIFKQGYDNAALTQGNSGAGLLIDIPDENYWKSGAEKAFDEARFWLAGVLKEKPGRDKAEFCRSVDPKGLSRHGCNMLVFSSIANWKEVWPLLFSIRPANKICDFRKGLSDNRPEDIDTDHLNNMTALERMLTFWTLVRKDEEAVKKLLALDGGEEGNSLAGKDALQLNFEEFLERKSPQSVLPALQCRGSEIAGSFGALHQGVASFIENMQLTKEEFTSKCGSQPATKFAAAGGVGLREAGREMARGGLTDGAAAYFSAAAARSLEEALAAYDAENANRPLFRARILGGLAMATRLDPKWATDETLQANSRRYAEDARRLDGGEPLALVVLSDLNAGAGDFAGAVQARAVALAEARERAARASPGGTAPSREDLMAAETAIVAAGAGGILAQFQDERRLREVIRSTANPYNKKPSIAAPPSD